MSAAAKIRNAHERFRSEFSPIDPYPAFEIMCWVLESQEKGVLLNVTHVENSGIASRSTIKRCIETLVDRDILQKNREVGRKRVDLTLTDRAIERLNESVLGSLYL